MPIGEVYHSVSLQALFDKLASPEISGVENRYGVKRELAKLQRTLRRLQAMLQDAEQSKTEGERFTLWLRELKRAAYEAEDVLDEYEYEDLRRKVQSDGEGSSTSDFNHSPLSWSSKVRRLLSFLSAHQISFDHEMARGIADIRKKLEEISKDSELISMGGIILDVGTKQSEFYKTHVRETSSLLTVPQVFGRHEVKEELIKLLLGEVGKEESSSSSAVHPTATCLSVLSIVGMGGLGKTTLAQWVYNNDQVAEYFQPRIWICVSQDFNLVKVTKQILEHVVDPQSGLQTIDNFNVLQQKLLEKMRGKRFLLVLDDVWEEDYNQWQAFSAPLIQGDAGSRVLITTRHANVAKTARSMKIELEGLSFDDCWSIFRSHAFTDANSDKHPILEPIGKEIVKKLQGVPLAATTIGGLLGSESEEGKWRDVLTNELWELKQGRDGIFPALKLSYEYLPPHLKPCFAYCSVYHKGDRFDMLELIQLWMAQGYVQPQRTKSVEDVGRDCLNELLGRSLIQFVDGKYVVHDLLHDLGQLILQHDCYVVLEPDKVQTIPEDAHCKLHLRVSYQESLLGELDILRDFTSLRTLAFGFYRSLYIEVPLQLFRAVKCLRVLDLSFSGLNALPNSICCLKHLRYIDLRRTKLTCLPDSFCALYKLQTLRLGGCDELTILPEGISNLISLHYLEAKHELVSNIARIGKLRHLQNLEVFSVSKENENRLGDLKNMNELRGKLVIRNLHGVKTSEEAFEAALKNKRYLEKLTMEWADDRDVNQIDSCLEESIIEGLQPPPHLKELTVNNYAGTKYPRWMTNSSISDLESLHLYRCMYLNPFPSLEQSRSLVTLNITSCPQLKELPPLPPALRNLILKDVGVIALPDSLHNLPLQQLVINQALELKKLPLLPPTLEELTVEGVGLQALPAFHQNCEFSAATSRVHDVCESSDNRNPALSILKIHGCPELTTLHEGLLNHRLRHLRVLSIKGCKVLLNWPEGEGFQSTLLSLNEELSIESCPKLKALPEGSKLHPSLNKLVVKSCPSIPNKSLFSQTHNFNVDDVFIRKRFRNLTDCVDETLQHILNVDWLTIEYLQELGTALDLEESVFFVYTRDKTTRWGQGGTYMSRRVTLMIKGRRKEHGVKDEHDATTLDDETCKLLCTCLGGHVWTSSLRELFLVGIPDRAFMGLQHMCYSKHGPCDDEGYEGGDGRAVLHRRLHLPSLETLRLWSCKEMTRLPTETLLSHLPTLKVLTIGNCPELTLSSVEAGIRSLPSLEMLQIRKCPKLLPLSPLPNTGGGGTSEEGSNSMSTPPPALPLPRLLRSVSIDDARLLTWLLPASNGKDNGCFFRHHLITSIRTLSIYELAGSLAAEEEAGLRTLASSLHCLMFRDCPNLENLPGDLRGLLPNLKVLRIVNCPRVRCLPDGGLPASLEFLLIEGCPELAQRCRPPQQPSLGGAEVDPGDWHKMAHVPVIRVDGLNLRGSLSRFLELQAKWDFCY